MIFHIVKRELYDHLSSLRFALTTLLILILMIVNAVAYLGEYKRQIKNYHRNVAGARDRLQLHCDTLYRLVLRGPGDLHKRPSPLAFCADGGEDLLFKACAGWHCKTDAALEKRRCFISIHRTLAVSLSASESRSWLHCAV